ncbi:hypothetical protein H9636_11925 [Ureibacillus sp. Re31]|uniref:Lipoprotein n=1 Tax=Ureibacillus galli TaxID=2762222 RepID=A0ABR8XDQ1_9BACL|nr:hypothetical protein [Ureibacillus galli]MBD8027363.1 hypothetical protein [Ureibacillus galli]
MKKFLLIPFSLLLAGVLVGCGNDNAEENDAIDDDEIINEDVNDDLNDTNDNGTNDNGTGDIDNTVGDEPLDSNGNKNPNEAVETEDGMGTNNNGNTNGTTNGTTNGADMNGNNDNATDEAGNEVPGKDDEKR